MVFLPTILLGFVGKLFVLFINPSFQGCYLKIDVPHCTKSLPVFPGPQQCEELSEDINVMFLNPILEGNDVS